LLGNCLHLCCWLSANVNIEHNNMASYVFPVALLLISIYAGLDLLPIGRRHHVVSQEPENN